MESDKRHDLAEKISDSLIMFVDFLYAVVFSLVVAEAFDKVISAKEAQLTLGEKTARLSLIIAIFYFLAWDWLHARLLTIKNPYKGYTRFFIELIIAFSAYGAAYEVMRNNTFFLIYLALILLLGVVWSWRALSKYPESMDQREFRAIMRVQSIFGIISLAAFWLLRTAGIRQIDVYVIGGVIILEWLFVLRYEMLVPRVHGILGGPGVPFLNRKRVEKIRRLMRRIRRRK